MDSFIATVSHPMPRSGSAGLDGLYHFIRTKFAQLGMVITKFYDNPSIQTVGTAGLQLVHIKFEFVLETPAGIYDEHRRQFRLPNDTLDLRTRSTFGTRCLERLNEFADAEAAYHALDKETRGPFNTVVTIRPLEVVHTPESAGKEAGEITPERFWKVKLVRPRINGAVTTSGANREQREKRVAVNFR
jgi:hypothetical protein